MSQTFWTPPRHAGGSRTASKANGALHHPGASPVRRRFLPPIRAFGRHFDGGLSRIERGQSSHHPIRPAESILRRILAAAAPTSRVDHVVLFHELAGLAIQVIDACHP